MQTIYIEAKDNQGNVKGGAEFDVPETMDEATELLGSHGVYKHFKDAYIIHLRSEFHKGYASKKRIEDEKDLQERKTEFYQAQADGKFEDVDEDTMILIKKSLKIL